MNRDYNTGIHQNVEFFLGNEVEHTPAKGMYTLFVVGRQPIEKIDKHLTEDVRHIFFGANHSFNPTTAEEWTDWEDTILHYLNKDYLCSLDMHLDHVGEFNEGGLNEYNNFIPQIRVPIPYIRLWNYNTTIKIDDRGFQSTNPGVWSHRLHDLMSHQVFTDWRQYKKDTIL